MVSPLPLKLSGAVVRRRGHCLVGPVDLEIAGRGITILLGPNGSGKTMLLRLMHGLERPRGGEVAWACEDSEARSRQSFVFQTPILMRRSVLDCVAYPLRLRGVDRAAANARAAEEVERAGLSGVAKLPAQLISGGERQKMALARALITAPDVLFLDEPCASLDGRATREIEERLKDAAENGVRIVMSTHYLGQARRLADDVIFLAHGKVLEEAAAASFFSDPSTEEARAFLDGRIVE